MHYTPNIGFNLTSVRRWKRNYYSESRIMSHSCGEYEKACRKINSETAKLLLVSCNCLLIFWTSIKFYLSLISAIFVLCVPNISYSQVNFWQQSSDGFDGGAIFALAIDSRNNTIYAGTGGGVLRSKDNGASWTLINSGLINIDVRSLAVDASGHVFAGTEGGGIFLSTDGGAHWEPVNSGLTVKNVWCFAVSPTGQIFAGTGGGHFLSPNGSSVFRSTDNGVTWHQIML